MLAHLLALNRCAHLVESSSHPWLGPAWPQQPLPSLLEGLQPPEHPRGLAYEPFEAWPKHQLEASAAGLPYQVLHWRRTAGTRDGRHRLETRTCSPLLAV